MVNSNGEQLTVVPALFETYWFGSAPATRRALTQSTYNIEAAQLSAVHPYSLHAFTATLIVEFIVGSTVTGPLRETVLRHITRRHITTAISSGGKSARRARG